MAVPRGKLKMSFNQVSSMTDSDAAGLLQHLKGSITQIFAENASQLSFEVLHRHAYNLVLHKKGQMLYEGVVNMLVDHLSGVGRSVAEAHDATLLQVLRAQWDLQRMILKNICDILMYMDHNYVQPNNKVSIRDVGVILFLERIIRHSAIRHRVKSILLSSVAAERLGEMIDAGLMRNILSMLVDAGIATTSVYEQEFERDFLAVTKDYYADVSLDALSHCTCPEYLELVERRLAEEQHRVRTYLHASTGPKLMDVLYKLLIEDKAKMLLSMEASGAIVMIQQDRYTDLKRMFTLFKLVPATVRMLMDTMKTILLGEGNALMHDQERQKNPVEFVQKLLDIRDKHTLIIEKSFSNDKQFHRVLREAFETFLNVDARCSTFLSLYVDEMMKHGFKGVSEADVDAVLDKVVIIFRYLRDKDVFEAVYKTHLQKRLLDGRSLSDDVERSMLTKLKAECGFQFTSKMEGMFTDLANSKNTLSLYRKAVGDSFRFGVEICPTVLTTGFWPIQSVPPCTLTPQLMSSCEHFRAFYLGRHTGRRLTWQTSLGTADLKTLYTPRPYELTVSTYQMCIMLMFNDKNDVSFRELASSTNIPLDELKRHLISLATPKFKILNRTGKTKEVDESETFSVNADFTSKLIKVKIPLVTLRSIAPEPAEAAVAAGALPDSVEDDRRHAIEAAIVRIMKIRKELDHGNLVAEVTRQLSARFQPTPQSIKKRVESLIEREYLERSEEDRRMYRYLA